MIIHSILIKFVSPYISMKLSTNVLRDNLYIVFAEAYSYHTTKRFLKNVIK